MAVQINVAANQAALTASIQAGVQAYNQRFAQNNQLNLTINQRAFSQPLGRITGDVKDFEAALAASNARVIAFGASTAVLGGVIRSFKELANVTIEVEKNLADINRVFGLTTSQLQKFSTDLFNVTKQTASSFNDASQAALEFSRQGLKAEETLQRTKDALTLTRLAGISTANAVDALTSTVNGFSATGVTTTQILNKLVAVEQDFAVGAGDLAEALSRTGQAAQEAGVSLDQLNALVTSAQQSTARGGAVIGNALKTIFTRLQRTDTLDQLEAFNIAVRDVQGNILPAVTILQNFAGAYKGLADAQRAQLSEQVAGVYQVNILKAIVNDLNKSQGVYAGALQRGAMATNEAEVATAKLNQTLDALLKQTATSTQQLANNIGKVTFEPLARYGTEQLKSLVESMNEILEGEGVGSTFANGLLKGIRNVIAGPGAIAAFFTLFKLIQNSFTYLSQALPQIAGITTETQNRKNIEQAILQIMSQQGPVAQALAGTMGNQAAQAQLLLQVARQQTAEYQTQTALARQLAGQLAGQGVRVRGAGGLQVTRAGGYIPASTKMAEVVGAQAGGYAPGKVVKSPVGGVMNTAEDVKYVPGFAQPFINPPAGSKAGRAHRQNAISRTGVDPYMYGGFIPNFALKNISTIEKIKDGDTISAFPVDPTIVDYRLAGADAPERGQLGYNEATQLLAQRYSGDAGLNLMNANVTKGKAAYGRGVFDDLEVSRDLIEKGLAVPDLRYTRDETSLNTAKNYYENTYKKGSRAANNPGLWAHVQHPKFQQFIHQFELLEGKEVEYKTAAAGERVIKNTDLYKKLLYKKTKEQFEFSGFIPNFATPMSTASIPWFKKYSSKYKNAAGDADLFKMGDFPTYGRGLDHEYAKKGNSAMLSYLHEDFVRSALNIALGSKKVIRPAEVGFKDKPVSDISNENDFDLLYRIADGSYSMLELKQDFKNISGSVTGFMNKKLANLEKENPVLAKKVSSMIAVSNRPKFTDPTGRNVGANFSEFEMAAASIVKDKYSNVDPSISAKLTKVTDGLLRRYEAKKNTTYDGFIPNFAGKDIVTKFFRTQTGPDLFSSKGTGLSGTVYRQPGYRSSGYQLKEQLNNMVMSILGNNVFFPDASSLNPKIYGDVNKGAENSAKTAALKLSSGGKTSSLGLGAGMMSEAFGNSRYVPDREAVFTGQVSGKMKRVNYDRLSDILGAFWSANPETKSAWESLKNISETGKFEEKQNIRVKTSLLKKAYEDFLVKNNYIGTRVKLNSYRKRAEGVEGVNYGALRSDLAGVSNVRNIDKYGGFIPNFAYKQAVMGLEESMSGNKAIFDTKPFPHIRNSSQPTFSSAISDHGGLGNALSDSMRGQKAAGLMSKGFIPNFNSRVRRRLARNRPSQQSSSSATPSGTAPNASPATPVLSNDDIDRAISDFINAVQSAEEKLSFFESAFGRNKLIQSETLKLENALKAGGVSGDRFSKAMTAANNQINQQQGKFAKGLSSASTAISLAGPMLAGFAEQALFGNRKRTEMTAGERQGQAAISTGISAVSTGAGIGAAFGPLGAGIGAAAGAVIGLVSAIDAAKLSLSELAQIDQELLNKQQASSQAASGYIDSQKKLNDLIASGASSSDIEDATKNLSISFNQIKDVDLAQIFATAGGNIEKLQNELKKYNDELTKKAAGKSALGNLQEGGGIFARMFLGGKTTAELGVKEPSEVAGELFRSSSMFKDPALIEAMRAGRFAGGDLGKAQQDYAKKFTDELFPDLEAIDYVKYGQEVQRSMDLLFGNSGEAIAYALERMGKIDASNVAIQKVRKQALQGFSYIFAQIERSIQTSSLQVAMALEKDSQINRINSAINEFTTNFSESIESFVMNSLPEGPNKLGFTQFTAQRKYDDAIAKQQISAENFRLSQQKERNDYQKTREENITKLFKDVSLQSEQSAKFFQTDIYDKVKSGDFSGLSGKEVEASLSKKLIDQSRSTGMEAVSNSSKLKNLFNEKKINLQQIDLSDKDNVSRLLDIAGEAQIGIGPNFTDIKDFLAKFQDSLSDLYNTQEFFTNKAKKEQYDAAIELARLEGDQFNQRMINAEKLFQVNQILEKTQLEATKTLSVERAKVDNANFMRMESMKNMSATIANNLEVSKAEGARDVNRLKRTLQDPAGVAGLGVSERSERQFKIQDQILQKERANEDANINAEIQQRMLELAAERENTTALYNLSQVIERFAADTLLKDLGGEEGFKEMQNNPYIGKNIALERANLGPEASSQQIDMLNKAENYSPEQLAKFEAYQITRASIDARRSGNTSTATVDAFATRMSSANFNKMDRDQQMKFLAEERTEADKAGAIALSNTIKRYEEQIVLRKQALDITREDVDEQVNLDRSIIRTNNSFAGRFKTGFGNLKYEGEEILLKLGGDLPKMFADGLVNGIKAAIRESDNLGEALMGIAGNFLDAISTAMMQSAVYSILGSAGFNMAGAAGSAPALKQKGGLIRAQSGMYISGTGSGDKYPALLENGEYVLNRNAVMAMGGPSELDKLNFSMAPRFASGGSFATELTDLKSMEEGMTTFGLENSKLYNELRDEERAKQAEKRRKAAERRKMIAGIVGSVVGMAASFGLMKAAGNIGMGGKAVSKGPGVDKPEYLGYGIGSSRDTAMSIGTGGQTGGLFTGKSFEKSNSSLSYGSRLSDIIPAYAEGGLYSSPIIKKYGVGMQNGGMYGGSSNNSNTVSNTNATNSFNFNTTVNRDGTIQMGADSTSYKQQDVELSNNLNSQVYKTVLDVIKQQQRFGGTLAGTRRPI